ncbi:MAG: thioesterase family protein [Nitriliruptoraceae bacterium]
MSTSLAVRFHELDPYGHVNHAVYLTYLEVARVERLERRGISLLGLAERTGVQLVVAEVTARYLAPAVAGDRLEVTCLLAERRRASARFHQEIRRNGDLLLEAAVRTATLDRHGRPCAMPGELVAALVVDTDGDG